MKFVDLFAGIGGFRLGLERHGFECVASVEKDKFARDSYEQIFGEEPQFGDINDVRPGELPDANLYTAGFPCQSFSIAGERGGFDDTRGTLFFEIMRLAKGRKPEYLLLENVRGLLNHDGGTTFGTILNTLADVGYDAEWQVLNSKNFGVPQNRERVFIVGHLGGISGQQVFPITGQAGTDSGGDGRGLDYAGSVSDSAWLDGDSDKSRGHHEGNRVYKDTGLCPTLAEHKGGHSGNSQLIKVGDYKSGKREIDNPETGRVYSDKGISPCLNTMGGGYREPKVVEERTDEGVREFNGKISGAVRSMDCNGDKRVVEQFTKGNGVAHCIDKNYWKGLGPGSVGKGRRTQVVRTALHHSRGFEFKKHSKFSHAVKGGGGGSSRNHLIRVPNWVDGPNDLNGTVRGGGRQSYKKKDNWDIVNDGVRIRKLTPRECWRLQGFPDWAFERAEQVNSDTQLYRQAGNSVTVNVTEAIAHRLKKLDQ